MPSTRTPEFVSAPEAARLLGVDKATLTRWAASGRIPYLFKHDGLRGPYIFDRAEILRVAAERKENP